MQSAENNLNCNGICTNSLFYFVIDIGIGRPYYPCYGNILYLSKDIMLVFGVLTIINFVLIFTSRVFFDQILIF